MIYHILQLSYHDHEFYLLRISSHFFLERCFFDDFSPCSSRLYKIFSFDNNAHHFSGTDYPVAEKYLNLAMKLSVSNLCMNSTINIDSMVISNNNNRLLTYFLKFVLKTIFYFVNVLKKFDRILRRLIGQHPTFFVFFSH